MEIESPSLQSLRMGAALEMVRVAPVASGGSEVVIEVTVPINSTIPVNILGVYISSSSRLLVAGVESVCIGGVGR